MSRRRLLAGLLAGLAMVSVGRAQTATKANTVDTGGPYAGSPLLGVVVMGKPCSFGDSYHYQVTHAGDLRVEGAITCPAGGITANKVNGNEAICRLGPKLRCTAPPRKAAAPIEFAVDDAGVRVGEQQIGWADPQQAAAVLSQLRQSGQNKNKE